MTAKLKVKLYQEYVDSQIEAGLMPSPFAVWLEHEEEHISQVKAVWVKVEWSESDKFDENELIPFKEFEKRCRNVARITGCNNGYTKTKCEILFDNGSRYGLRLDLAENDDHGFEDRAKKTIAYYEKKNEKGTMDSYVEFLKRIIWE